MAENERYSVSTSPIWRTSGNGASRSPPAIVSAALARRLSQIGVVADGQQGAALQGALLPGQRLVTREGALWRWDGFTARAKARSSSAKRLEQKNRLEELRSLLAEAETAAEEAQRQRDQGREESKAATAALRQARAALGGAIFILCTVWSVFFGKPMDEATPSSLEGAAV